MTIDGRRVRLVRPDQAVADANRRFDEACDAALDAADRVASRVIDNSPDALAVALAANLQELVALTRRLKDRL